MRASRTFAGWLLALGLAATVPVSAQVGHGGMHGGVTATPQFRSGAAVGPMNAVVPRGAPAAHFGAPFRIPNAVSSQVGVGNVRNYYGPTGFHNPRPTYNGPYRSGNYGPGYGDGRRRNGVAVGILPIFPFYGGYGGYDSFGEPYDYNSTGYAGEQYDPSLANSEGGPYSAGAYGPGPGPYADSYAGQPFANQQGYPPPVPLAPQQPQATPMPPAAPAADATAPVASLPPVTVVLRSGQQMKIENFAVANGFFWDFSKGAPHKIPIASIDLAASAKATEESGGEFPNLTAKN